MQDLLTILNRLRRPNLMMRAARIGAEEYRRRIHLPRLLGYGQLPRHGAALSRLMEMEGDLELQRTGGDANYDLTRHIEVLIAMVAEARDYRRARASA
ncbi:MAG: DUF6477 family protein [Sulfitobacter sp.]|nr:DUF6477 family protein [Sulfitobacter sp.]